MMGSESDPKDGKVVAGSIFWAVLVYAVRLSFFLLVAANPQPGLLSPCLPPTQHARSGGGGKKKKRKKKKQDLILRGGNQVFLVFCGLQAILHYRASKRGAISLN